MSSDNDFWIPIVKTTFEEMTPECFERVLRATTPRQRFGSRLDGKGPRQRLRFEVSRRTLGMYIEMGLEKAYEKHGVEFVRLWLADLAAGERTPQYAFLPVVAVESIEDDQITMSQSTPSEIIHV